MSVPGSAASAATSYAIERPKYAALVQPFEPYDAWRLGPPIPGCQDERIVAAKAIAEYRTPSDPAVGARLPRSFPGASLASELAVMLACQNGRNAATQPGPKAYAVGVVLSGSPSGRLRVVSMRVMQVRPRRGLTSRVHAAQSKCSRCCAHASTWTRAPARC